MIKKFMMVFCMVVAMQNLWFVGLSILHGAGIAVQQAQEKFFNKVNAILAAGQFNQNTDGKELLSYLQSGAMLAQYFAECDVTFVVDGAKKNSRVLIYLLNSDKSFDVNQKFEDGITLLMLVAWHNLGSLLPVLFLKGANVNAKTDEGQTALQGAAVQGYTGMVQLLLKRPEIDVNAKTNNGKTALYLAAANGHTQIVELLLARPEIDVNAPDNSLQEIYIGNPPAVKRYDLQKTTPLYMAAFSGHEAVVELLLKHKNINVNAQDSEGRTPLYIATAIGYEGVVKRLQQAGADPLIKDKNGKSALDIAQEKRVPQTGLEQLTKALSALKAKLSELAGKLHSMK